MKLTRRETSKLLLAGAAVPALAVPGRAASPKDWARRLQNDLEAHLVSGCDGTLTLKGFGMGDRGGRVHMAGIIQLDWPPGMRRRRFDASGDSDDATYDQLLNQALFSFSKAWPGCVV